MTKVVVRDVLVAFAVFAWSVAAQDASAWNGQKAIQALAVDTNGIRWVDGRLLPMEGRPFADTENFYDRLPANVTTNVNAGVRGMKRYSAGMSFRFRTNAKRMTAKWTLLSTMREKGNRAVRQGGIDIYGRTPNGAWHYVRTGSPTFKDGLVEFDWTPGEECLINLPLYGGIRDFSLGLPKDARIEAPAPHLGASKPVVFYGTSITHGGCASRPGLSFAAIVGRELDVPIVNLGFSGSGVMEFEMSEHIARIDASCYILDCLWNMSLSEKERPGRAVETNYEPFIRNLRAKRPGVPIIMAEQCDVYCRPPCDKDRFIRALYEKLVAEGWKDLVYLPKTNMYSGDREGTVDGCHPNDLGMRTMAFAFGNAVREALAK
ncbi:MAG: SGNH/GDSL hydrolase family protein [Kiritimatiellae bacterium]|nr:SGNH/GDSL hydrolase family protein [Kiritimatiellia bacterium]